MSDHPRFRDALTPEARLAVVIVTFYKQFTMKFGHDPDYAAVEVVIKPYLDTFEVEVRCDEMHTSVKTTQMERLKQLDRTLIAHLENMQRLRLL